MLKTFAVVAILTPDQTGVINNTEPFAVETAPSSGQDAVSRSSGDYHEIGECEGGELDCGTDCAGTEEEGADDHGCASDSQGAVALPEQ